jgi:hypothetical protein
MRGETSILKIGLLNASSLTSQDALLACLGTHELEKRAGRKSRNRSVKKSISKR